MKKLLIALFALLSFLKIYANPGDTVVVQAFSFGTPQDAWFVFPSDTMRCEKVLMKYTLKCNPAQSPACGEWDYLTYTYLYKHTGLQDSILVHQPTYTVNGQNVTPFSYMNSPTYNYRANKQYYIVHDATTSLSINQVGNGNVSINKPFGASNAVSRSQYLWKASELIANGITAGNITGMQFFVQTIGSSLRNLNVQLKNTSLDSLTQGTFNTSGFASVFNQTTNFTNVGWNSLQFTNSFNWDGVSNLLIDIGYSNLQSAMDVIIASSPTVFHSGLVNANNDRVASFHTNGYINVPLNNKLASIDSFVSVALWCYGAPAFQPQDGTAFEAVDSLGNRILNSHLPWSDSNVYWDAGYGGTSYDRINKLATAIDIKGKWNYWVFTKNVNTGSMKIYLNGTLWHSGTSKVKRMRNIKTFRIGKGNWNGSQTYEGKIDEFAVFNKELSAATILNFMNKQIDITHPNYNDLAVYYHFDDGNYQTFADAAPAGNTSATAYAVDNPMKTSNDVINNFTQSYLRPNIKLEQGVYVSHLDSTYVIDSTVNAPLNLTTYYDSINNPGIPTNSNVWPSYYNQYVFDANGNAIDSTLVTPDNTITLGFYNWYRKFPQIIRYELARYITPYGNGLSLGNGWTWTFDVSDYRTLLAGNVHLSAGNWQELLDVKFLLVKGIPPRDPISVTNLWNGGFNYGQANDPIDNHLQPITLNLAANALNTRWKSRITGHGMDSPQNCAEFCAKNHYFKVNGNLQFTKSVWRDNCDLNPLYPQGGTWVYDRANWCPGAEVWTYDWELSGLTQAGNNVTLDHDVQSYTNTSGWDYYQIEDQLITYSAPNFSLDAALEDVLAPSANQMWARMNPICTNPTIKIKNNGTTPLTSLTITFGIVGGTQSVFNWSGNLPFLQSETITLGNFAWIQGASKFKVSISNPNGGTDQYLYNNEIETKFTYPTLMPASFVIEMKSNLFSNENQYSLKDDAGNIILSRSNLSVNTVYRDTLTLSNGCYTFELTDSGEDGLNWWANPDQGSGYLRFRNANNIGIIKTFNADFGGQVYQQFTVGLTNGVEEYLFEKNSQLNVYPNPSDGKVLINLDLNERKDATVEIMDLLGKRITIYTFKKTIAESIEADLSYLKAGVYFVSLQTGYERVTKKLIIQ